MSDINKQSCFKNMSDKELALVVRGKNDLAFEEMAGRYINFIYSIAAGFYADGFDMNDFAQEGLLMLLAACNTFDETSGMSFKNYLALCIKRRYISIQRKSKAKGVIPSSNIIPIDDAADSIDYSLNPEELMFNREYLRSLISRIENDLSQLELKVLSHYLAGCTYLEISARIGLPVKAVDNALQRIRKKLNANPLGEDNR